MVGFLNIRTQTLVLMSHNVITINNFWASVLGGIMIASASGGAITAKAIYDGLSNEIHERELLSVQIKPLLEAHLETRMVGIEGQLRQTVETSSRIETQQGKLGEKIDTILDRQRK